MSAVGVGDAGKGGDGEGGGVEEFTAADVAWGY